MEGPSAIQELLKEEKNTVTISRWRGKSPLCRALEVLRTEVLPRREPKLSLADSDEVGP